MDSDAAMEQVLPQSTFRYNNLDETKAEIRLLELNVLSDELEGTLSHFSCDTDYPVYVALSYCWGSREDPQSIIINGATVYITKNLAITLRHIREHIRWMIWVDAICINQSDDREKGHQVSRMGEIYSHGLQTIAWLGPDDMGQAKAAFALVELLRSKSPYSEFASVQEEIKKSISERRRIPRWAAFRTLLGMPYWTRIWIIQELALSVSVSIQWGEENMSLSVFKQAVYVIQQNKQNKQLEDGFRQIVNLIRVVHNFQARQAQSLHELLSYSCSSLASEPCDKVLALVGLATDGRHLVPFPDYEKPLSSIFIDIMVRRLLIHEKEKSNGLLDLICIDNPLLPKPSTYPSWTTHWPSLWTSSSSTFFSSTAVRGLNAGYLACGTSLTDVRFTTDKIVLSVRGFLFDYIDSLTAQRSGRGLSDTSLPNSNRYTHPPVKNCPWLRDYNRYGGGSGTYDAIWRSLVRNQVSRTSHSEAKYPHPSMATQFSNIWLEDGIWSSQTLHANYSKQMNAIKGFDIYGRTLFEWSQLPVPSQQSLFQLGNIRNGDTRPPEPSDTTAFVEEVARKFVTLCCGMMVTSRGYIGLAHAQAQLGDVIALLSGCTMPMILRTCPGGYRVIGEAYVHGIMDGSFWKERVHDNSPMQMFDLY